MTWSLGILGYGILGFFVHINAQRDPVQALMAAGAVGAALWFVVAQSRRREARRTESRREGNHRQPRSW
ncbi:MAG: hypothetical protein M3Q30_10790 [Actinomycetota bacterium]|nr:hypothetical protein [Actinomycetota bacterium]